MARFALPPWNRAPAPAAPAYEPDPADLGTELGLEARLGGEVPAPPHHDRSARDAHAPHEDRFGQDDV
ncbi:MAG: hypothetical protein KatS3mg122_1884 [Caldimonas sp.]|uniref:hypothetical protein n=1 Tax=Caldimonas manganoxidans TaxID=196015 RepID=UPI000380300C|nr:hypothetical protein [Caldimonas manganoxidans]GIX24653.1 MAG: hypothetical protein KatS3mg122_1884 [Caldimonas sp.]